jgi:hypothetical protein
MFRKPDQNSVRFWITCGIKRHHLADLKVEVGLVSASLRRAIRVGDGSTSGLVARETNTLTIKGVAINSVERVVSDSVAVRSTPDQLGSVGRVVVRVLGQTEAVALALDGSAEVAAVGCNLHLRALLAGTGGGEEDVLVAVVLDACGAGEGGGGKSDDAGEDSGGVHGCDGWSICLRLLEELSW